MRRWWPVALAAVLLLGAAALATVTARSGVGRHGVAAGGPGAPADGAGPPAALQTRPPKVPAAPPPVAAPIAPAGYQIQHEPERYWIATPKGWEGFYDAAHSSRDWEGELAPKPNNKVLFFSVIDQYRRAATAQAALASYEAAEKRGEDNRLGRVSYHRIRFAQQPLIPGARSVAELEFTQIDTYYKKANVHGYVREVVTQDGWTYTLAFWVFHDQYFDKGTADGDWQRALPAVQKILASFRLG
jgi:hypothetical protein